MHAKKNKKNENKKIIKKKDYPKNKLETTHFKKIIQKYKTSKKRNKHAKICQLATCKTLM